MRIFLVSLLVAFCFVGATRDTARAQQSSAPPIDDPHIKLRGIDGKMYDISEMKGSVLLVSFGATWCAPCTKELHAIEELRLEYKERAVQFLWVNIERREEISDGRLRDYARENGFTLPILRDPTQLTFAQFSTRVRLPMVIYFDKEGRLSALRHTGMTTPEVYKKIIRGNLDQLLNGATGTNQTNAK